MHTSQELTSDQFEITIEGHPAQLGDILPEFGEQSRLGIIVRDDFGAVGASSLITATVTAFYDIQRDLNPEGFFRYADYYLFHTGRVHGAHPMLDVFPDHKEVVVADDPERILRAVNDRGVTHLLVPEGPSHRPEWHPETLNGAMQRIKSALLYSPSGRVDEADVVIKGNDHVDFYVWATLEPAEYCDKFEANGGDPKIVAWERSRLGEVEDEVATEILGRRESLKISGRTVESFRRVSIDQAICRLSPNPVAEIV